MNEEFNEWLHDSITQELLAALRGDIELFQVAWSGGSFLKQSDKEQAFEAGMREALEMLLEAVETGEFLLKEAVEE